jgi:hypothetical protein
VIQPVAGRGNQYDIERAGRVAPEVMEVIRSRDPNMLVGWDSSACRWSFLRVSRGGYHFIGVIETEDHRYRPLDMSVVADLFRWDMWKGARTADEYVDQLEAEEEAHEAKVARDFRDDLRHATRDNRRTLRRGANLVGL